MASNFFKVSKGMTLKGQTTAPSDPSNGDEYYDSALGKFRFYQSGAWVDLEVSASGLFNYVTNPDASADATTGVTVTGANWNVTRGTTAATFSDSYFFVNNASAIAFPAAGNTIAWSLTTLQAKHSGQLMRFSMRIKPTFTDGVYKIGLYDGAAYVPGTELVLTSGTNITWESTFVLDITKTYTVRIECTSSETGPVFDMYVDDITVSPELTVSGAAITNWQAFTPSWSVGTGTLPTFTTPTGFYRRVGDSMELLVSTQISANGTGTSLFLTLPGGLHTDTTKVPTNADYIATGYGYHDATGGTVLTFLTVVPDTTTTTRLYFIREASDDSLDPADFAVNDGLGIRATIPITEWAGGTLTMTNSQVEYVYNSSGTTTAGATTSTGFAYGTGGAAVGAIDSVTANSFTQMDVRFLTPIKVTDRISLQFAYSADGPWQDVGDTLYNSVGQSTSFYGANWIRVSGSTTDIRVRFGNKGSLPSNATYAGNGSTWTGESNLRWRVVKSSNPIGIGAGLVSQTEPGAVARAGRLLGQTDGSTIPAGYVGEIIQGSAIAASTAINTTSVLLSTLALTPGVWEIRYSVTANVLTTTTNGNRSYLYTEIRANDGTTVYANTSKLLLIKTTAAVVGETEGNLVATYPVNISTGTGTTNYKLYATSSQSSGNTVYNTGGETSQFYAIRIA